VAVKEFEFDRSRYELAPAAVVDGFSHEIKMLRKVQHPNVLKVLGARIAPR
jgi:hypothetical protein